MKERSIILLDEFENDPDPESDNKLYTESFTEETIT